MKLTQYKEDHSTCRVLITGLSKSGKSTLAATLARKYRLIWLDVENAAEALLKLPLAYQENIDLIKIPDSASFPVAAQTIQRLFKEKKASICFKHGVINCPACVKSGGIMQQVDLTNLDPARDIVVLDTLTQVGASFLAHILKSQPIDYKPVLDDWGGLRKNSEFLGSNIQSVDFNLVCTALTVEAELEDGKVKMVPAFGSKGMSANIAAKFSTVIYCEVKNKKHYAYSGSTASNLFLTGSRSDYEIEKQVGELDLCPMMEQIIAKSGKSAVETQEAVSVAAPTVSNSIQSNVTQGAKTTLLSLKERMAVAKK